MIPRVLRCVSIVLIPLLAASCGYRSVRYRTAGGEVPSISIVTLDNDSYEVGIELIASDALRREMLTRGGLRLVDDPGGADYVLRGRVLPLETRSRSFTGVILAVEHTVTLSLEVRVDGPEGAIMRLPESELRVTDIYLSSADIEAQRKNRQEAVRRLSGLLAARVSDGIDRELLGVVQ